MEKERVYSNHIFIYPFKLVECKDKKGKRKENILVNSAEWEHYIPVASNEEYTKNMLKYFTTYAKESLFEYGDDGNDKYVMELYNKNIKNCEFKIEYGANNYILNLLEVRVKFFDTSVGLLAFVLENKNHEKIEDVLSINTYGRKLFKAYEKESCPTITINDSIKQDIGEAEIEYEEDKEYLRNNIINYFLKKKKVEPIMDDRMYTLSQYIANNKNSGVSISSYISNEKRIEQDFLNYWYQYIYVDSADFKTCQNKKMEKELVEKSTYYRWSNWGTYFGATRYSFMIWNNTGDFGENVLPNHLKTIYFQLVSILIAQKSSIIYLNDKINDLLEKKRNKNNENNENDIYEEYLTYLSKLTFREITCQEQGIELYDLCRKQMNIEVLNEELNIKVQTLNDRSEREIDKRELEMSKKIEIIGFSFAIISLALGFLGIDSSYLTDNGIITVMKLLAIGIKWTAIIVVLTVMGYYFVKYLKTKILGGKK